MSSKWKKRRDDNIEFLATTFQQFPQLETLKLVIDGRQPAFNGPVEFVEPSPEFEDFHKAGGRVVASAWIEGLLADLKISQSALKICPVQISLLMNGKSTSELELRWDYYHACCYVRNRGPSAPIAFKLLGGILVKRFRYRRGSFY